MSQLDEVLERLLTEPEFGRALAEDPATALATYRLTADELELLGSHLEVGAGANGAVEDRQSKSALFGLFAQAIDLAHEAGPAGAAPPPREP